MFDPRLRKTFDEEFETALAALPAAAQRLLEEVAILVEDYPSEEVLAEMGARRDELCGLYTGTPTTEHSVDLTGEPSDVIHIYREGLLALARTRGGRIDAASLREEIRITLLHELAHRHGFDEDQLDELGYS